jgi:hypothetical protein
MNSSGFWGFNTTAPNARVHINSAGEDPFRVQVNGATKLFVDDGGGVSVGSSSIAPANGLFVSGNTGIGTAAPEGNLHVFRASAGAVTANGNSPLVIENNTSTHISLLAPLANESGILFGNPTNNAEGAIIYNPLTANHGMLFITNGADAMTLGSNGSLYFTIKQRGFFFANQGGFFDGDAGQVATNGDLVPYTDGSNSLGTNGRRWFDIWAIDVTVNSSDARLKKNIEHVRYGHKEILELHPVSYRWIKNPDGQDGPKRLGLLAQEVQQVIPEVVRNWCYKTDEKTGKTIKQSTATLGLQYDAIIPVLIKGMQEQQKIIATLEDRIAKLESQSNAVMSNTKLSNDASSVVLEQNEPNPYNQTTIIRYRIPAGANAQINIYNSIGTLVKSTRTTEKGQVQINAGELKAGTYTYSLVVDGKLFASKKMVTLK